MISTVTAGAILFVAFFAAVVVFRQTEYVSAGRVLEPELMDALGEVREHPAHPDLQEIVAADPNVTVAVFQSDGRVSATLGALNLRPIVGFGRTDFNGISSVYKGIRSQVGTVIIAKPWGEQAALGDRLALLAFVLWVACTVSVCVVAWVSTKAAFTPLEALSIEAEAMSGNQLSDRLSVNDRDEYAAFVERLNRFLDRIESSAKREERFVADAAHELRTPLTILRGQIESSLSRPRTDSEYQETLNTVLDETERMSRMVELLLQSGVSESKKADVVDIEQEIERVHARWVDQFFACGIQLHLESSPAKAAILSSEFGVILDNLLANALKASPRGSECSISLCRLDEFARIEVKDQGCGIPEDSRELVFERLTRLDTGRNRKAGGFGIGLAVCRRIVQNRKGTIFIAPSDRGARFVVELPIAS